MKALGKIATAALEGEALKIGYLSIRHHFSYEDALFGVQPIFKQSHILMFYDTRLEFK
jgi:hypothetical protein